MLKKLSITLLLSFCLIWSLGIGAQEVPENYNQSPLLKKQVESGELAPLEKRLPQQPYVAETVDEIGQYGGTAQTVTTRPRAWGEDIMMMAPFANLIRPTPSGDNFIPHLAKKMVSSNNDKTWTIYLREGTRWSDGHPFTADDIMFWYEDILLNEKLTPSISVAYKTENEVAQVEKINDYTVEFDFKAPKPYFKHRLAVWNGQIFAPEHYLKQFHPNYVEADVLKEKISEANYDNWWELFGFKNTRVGGVPMNPDLPSLTAFELESIDSDSRILVRNPYYWKVDEDGNQLPYLDKISTEIITDPEVEQGMIMSGEIDFAIFNTDIRNYPMYKKYESEAGFRTILLDGLPNEVVYMLNMNHEDPTLRNIFQDVRFRKALSLAIDRDEINESIYFGRAEPRQVTVANTSQWYEPEFANSYIEFNPEKAKNLLDEMGLKDEDGDGWREDANGDKISFTIEYYTLEAPKIPNVELVTQQWQDVGIDVNSKTISGELQAQRAPANMLDATVFQGHCATDTRFPVQPNFWVPEAAGWETSSWPLWSNWLTSNGENGEEPPSEVKNLYNWWQEMLTEPDQEKRIELGKKILQSQAENIWVIGTVGNGPYPLIVDENLRNVPTSGTFTSSTGWSWCTDPSMFYFKE